MARKTAFPIELHELYDERAALRVRISLLEDSGRDPAELAVSREQLMAVNHQIALARHKGGLAETPKALPSAVAENGPS